MNPPRNEMVSASAGSGKTRELAARYVRLLLLGVEPWRIVALTFTCKAANEFLDRIIRLLCDLADDPRRAVEYFPDAEPGEITTEKILDALERLVRNAGRLRLGTIDSFFVRMVRAFALELGLPGVIEILQGAAESAARHRVLRHLLRQQGEVEKALFEAFEAYSHGEARLNVASEIMKLIEEYHALFLESGTACKWGNTKSIWPTGCPWYLNTPDHNFEEICTQASKLADQIEDKRALEAFNRSLEELASWRSGASLANRNVKFLTERLLPLIDSLEEGNASFKYARKTISLKGDLAKAVAKLLRTIVGSELNRRLERTRGVSYFLSVYEALHDPEIRAAGGLAFADLPALLHPQRFTQVRLLDYRLDGAIDHWLLDEFQDTSRSQWKALQNLVDEIIQNLTGDRSFFAVGDVKQAIYSFRGGDPGLFHHILTCYNRSTKQPAITLRHLDTTYRLTPPIVEAINEIFCPKSIPDFFPKAARDEWEHTWITHQSGRTELNGYARIVFFDKKTSTAEEDDATDSPANTKTESAQSDYLSQIHQAVFDRLNTLQPWRRGLSCALLCRTNREVREWTQLLRQQQIPCSGEGTGSPALDNDLGAVVQAIVRIAAHPGDTAAFEFLRMTPFANGVSNERLTASDNLREALRSDGFEPTLRRFFAPQFNHLDAFNIGRLADLLAAAADFDSSCASDPDTFLEWLAELETPYRAAPGTVAVMTIHKAKGLEFDVVFVPVTPTRQQGPKGGEIHVMRDQNGEPTAVIELPQKEFVMADTALRQFRLNAQTQMASDMLRLLYVAFTRPRRELHVFCEKPGSGKEQKTDDNPLLDAADFLAARFGKLSNTLEFGDSDWFSAHTMLMPVAASAPRQRTELDPTKLRTRLRRVSHSSMAHPDAALETVNWKNFGTAGVELGLSVHDLFSRIEWLDAIPQSLENFLLNHNWSDRLSGELVFHCLCQEEIFESVFQRPNKKHRLLREAPFEWIRPKKNNRGEWLSGVFDRVIVRHDADGRANSALIVDFKTDTAPPEEIAERYAPQLFGYRDALAAIEGLAPASIELALLHVREGKLLPLNDRSAPRIYRRF